MLLKMILYMEIIDILLCPYTLAPFLKKKIELPPTHPLLPAIIK